MKKLIVVAVMAFVVCWCSFAFADEEKPFKAVPGGFGSGLFITVDVRALDEESEGAKPEPIKGVKSLQDAQLAYEQTTYVTDLPLNAWTENVTSVFAPPRFNKNASNQLEMRPNMAHPSNTYGFWQSPSFPIKKPSGASDLNSVTCYVDYMYSAVKSGHRIPTFRLRVNRTDFMDAAVYQLDGRMLKSYGGKGTMTLKFDNNILTADTNYYLSMDMIYFDAPADPDFTFVITKAYVFRVDEPQPSDYIINGLWGTNDEKAFADINGYIVKLLKDDFYSGAYNDQIAALIETENAFRREYSLHVWCNDVKYFVNEDDTYQTAVCGRYVAYLEQDGDLKIWSPFNPNAATKTIMDDVVRIASGGADSLTIWDDRDNIYIWNSVDGLYKTTKDSIWFLCDSTSLGTP